MTISEETFFLDPAFEGTLQKQIQSMVAEGILSGRFRPGEKLPSSRGLARHLGISRKYARSGRGVTAWRICQSIPDSTASFGKLFLKSTSIFPHQAR